MTKGELHCQKEFTFIGRQTPNTAKRLIESLRLTTGGFFVGDDFTNNRREKMKKREPKKFFMTVTIASDEREMLHRTYRTMKHHWTDLDIKIIQRVTTNLAALITLEDEVQS
jgi:hypothetical protein